MREPEQWCFTAIGKLCMIGTKMKGGNQKLLIRDEQTIHWPQVKGQNDDQWSTKHYTEN
jgi:hypothetical protein